MPRRDPETNQEIISQEEAAELRIKQTFAFLDQLIRDLRNQYGRYVRFKFEFKDYFKTGAVDLDAAARIAGLFYSERDHQKLSELYLSLFNIEASLTSARAVNEIIREEYRNR